MRTYALEDRGSTPLYEYLYRCIREDILAGALATGKRLASTRLLARSSRQAGASGAGAAGGAGGAGRGRSTSATKKPRLGRV